MINNVCPVRFHWSAIYLGAFLFGLIVSINSFAQLTIPTKSTSKEFTPATPEGAALGKYGDVSVSYHTGVPNVSIPVFTIPMRSFSLPISLSYHGGGIKTDEMPTRVGLGWVLNAGGSVSVATMSKSDFNYPIWQKPAPPWTVNSPVGAFIVAYPLTPPPAYFQLGSDFDLGYNFIKGFFNNQSINVSAQSTNFEPDDISYNFCGYSGKLLKVKDGTHYETMPVSGLIVKDNLDIIDEAGVIYKFGEMEASNGSSDPFATSYNYFITKLKTLEGDSIIFTYDYEYQQYTASVSQSINSPVAFINTLCSIPDNSATAYTVQGIDGKRLKQIKSSNGYQVDFEYNSNPDMSGAHPLEKIIIRYNINGSQSEITRFNLYRNGAMLDSLKQSGIPSYKFGYYDAGVGSGRLSFSQDLWGYTNGVGQLTFIPTLERFDFVGADRRPDSIAMRGLSLKQIIYPTGGKTVFNFESKTYVEPVHEVWNEQVANCNATANQNIVCNFTVGNDLFGRAKMTFDLDTGGEILVKNETTNVQKAFLINSGTYAGNVEYHDLTPGYYSVTINNFGEDLAAHVEIKWKTLDTLYNTVEMGGGIRIKSITNYTADGIVSNFRSFNYNIPGTSTPSSIIDKIPNVYRHFAEENKQFIPYDLTPGIAKPNPYNVTCGYNTIHSSDISRSPRPQSTEVSYEFVTETNYNSKQGKTVYQFSKPSTFGVSDPAGNYTDVTNHMKGNLLNKKDYVHVTGTTYSLVREEITEYDFDLLEGNYYSGYKFGQMRAEIDHQATLVPPTPQVFFPAELWFYSYDLRNCKVSQSKKIVKDYTAVATIQSQSLYEYDNSMLLKETSIVGKDTIITTNSYYFLETPFVTPRTINKPIRVRKSLNRYAINTGNEIVDAKKLDYQFVSGKLVPKEMFYLENDALLNELTYAAALNSRIVFNDYDTRGNPLTITGENSIKSCFLWGANDLLLAQATNASASQICYTSFENGDSGGFTVSGTILSNTNSKTSGKYLSTGSIGKSGLTSASYKYTCWVRKSGGSNGTLTINSENITISSSAWQLIERTFTGTSLSVGLSGVDVDEARLHPSNAQMTSYTYKPGVGVSTINDANNTITYYEYDASGRLYQIKDKSLNVVKRMKYNYRRGN